MPDNARRASTLIHLKTHCLQDKWALAAVLSPLSMLEWSEQGTDASGKAVTFGPLSARKEGGCILTAILYLTPHV